MLALKQQREAEERQDLVHYLRPSYQDPKGTAARQALGLAVAETVAAQAIPTFPGRLAEQSQGVRLLRRGASPHSAAGGGELPGTGRAPRRGAAGNAGRAGPGPRSSRARRVHRIESPLAVINGQGRPWTFPGSPFAGSLYNSGRATDVRGDQAVLGDVALHGQERLRLTHPPCQAWVRHMLEILEVRLTPEQALHWWIRLHIGLRNKAPLWLLPEDWEPGCPEACWLEAYAIHGVRTQTATWHE